MQPLHAFITDSERVATGRVLDARETEVTGTPIHNEITLHSDPMLSYR